MKVVVKHYRRPKSRGAAQSSLGLLSPLSAFCFGFVSICGAALFLSLSELGIFGILASLLFVILALVFFRDGALLFWRNSRFSTEQRDRAAAELLEADHEICLLLRPFDFDQSIHLLPTDSQFLMTDEINWATDEDERDRHESIELFDALASSLSGQITLIAVGERMPGHRGGPGLVELANGEWQTKVAELMLDARYLFIMPWATSGTLWELNEILSRGMTEKTVFIMPPNYGVQRVERMVIPDGEEHRAHHVNFYYKIPIERLENEHPMRMVPQEYLKATAAIQEAGLETPEYDPSGCLFFYKSSSLQIRPIPYFEEQMEAVLEELRIAN